MTIKWDKTPGLQRALASAVRQKLTAAEIADRLSAKFKMKIGRKAVMGRVRRTGLQLAAPPGYPHGERGKKPRTASGQRRAPSKALPIVALAPTPRGDVPTGCRWMHGDHLRERNFCGAARVNHSPWCGFHWPIVYDVGATARSAAAMKKRLMEANR